MFTTDLQQTVYYDRYARWRPEDGRRETWPETVDRVMTFFGRELGKRNLYFDTDPLTMAMLAGEVMPSMRVVQMAGPALERCNVGAYNCSYLPIADWKAFAEILYILMQGTGVGFSVENQYIDQLPTVTPQTKHTTHTDIYIDGPHRGDSSDVFPWPTQGTRYICPIEDTTEGWCDALAFGLNVWSRGHDVVFDYSRIRPHGTPLATKGGRASGPEPLRQLLDFARKLILRHQGRKLSSLNCHDLACFCGSIVQVGGVRRAAEISLSDLSDKAMRGAKTGQFWLNAPERAMANNSAVYDAKPSMSDFMAEWTELMNSGTGERGIFNREGVIKQLPARRESVVETKWGNKQIQFGVNPCGEIILRPYQFCNLSIVVARPDDDQDTLTQKVILATQFGMIQSLLTDFGYLRPEWQSNCEEERLLGVDITGQMDNAVFFQGPYNESLYTDLKEVAINEAARLSTQFNIPMPAAVTCVKPSGNSSQLLGTASGLHPRYAQFYIRRIRIGSDSPIAKFLIANGVTHHPENGQNPDNPTVWVFDFPVAAPKGAVVREHMTALDQLAHWLVVKQNFTEHNPSITVYVRENEWMEVGAWVYKNWDSVGGISFLPWDGGVYNLPPYEKIDQATYNQLMAAWPSLDWTQLPRFEGVEDTTTLNNDYACVGGSCEL